MIRQIAEYLHEHREELDLPSGLRSDFSFLKVGGNPWEKGRINFLVFNRDESAPVLFIKGIREKDKDESLRREYSLIQKLASHRELIPFLPLPIHMVSLSGQDVLIQKACRGERMLASLSKSSLLHFQKKTISGNFYRAMEFVSILNTSVQSPLSPTELKSKILSPFISFYEDYGCSERNKIALERLLDKVCHLMGDSPCGTLIHGDCSATNIFLDTPNQIKIIDWETASENSLPFLDLFYFMSKYIHNLKIMPKNRWERVRYAYFGKNWFSDLISKTVQEYCEQTHVSPELGHVIFPLHFLNKARIKYSMRAKEQTEPWMNLFEYSMNNLDDLCF
ncbi:MAG: hypothetical protein QUS13_13215 [Smithella sp.]|nr:hypothetical protein [Smithella sp.]